MSQQPADVRTAERAGIRTHIRDTLHAALLRQGAETGLIGELGGPHNSICETLPDYRFEFLSLYGVDDDPRVRVADITECPQIESERYDAVFSVSVFEHVDQPWKAAKEIERILKPGGVTFHLAPFSYFYHKAPEDYWRYTPPGFAAMFEGLEVEHEEFYGANRRRDNRGSATNAVDRDGGSQFAVDDLGGWRENWHTIYVGRKPLDGGMALLNRRRHQLVVDLIKVQMEDGVEQPDAVKRAAQVLAARAQFSALPELTVEEAGEVWAKRPDRVKPSAYRWSRAAAILR